MKVANCRQMREIDSETINKLGIPGIVLMENAAAAVVKEIETILQEMQYRSIVVFCGKGNNGGDGFAIARRLYNMGANVLVVVLADREEIKGDARINLEIIEKMDLKIVQVLDDSFLEEIAASLYLCDLVVDAILGTGAKGDITGVMRDIIHLINTSGKRVIAVDIPSGVNGDTGEVCGIAVNADVTVTFGLPKLGLLTYPGAGYVGRLVVADISIPDKIIEERNIHINTIDNEYVRELLPVRNSDSHKGDYGKVFIVAGSRGLTGAAAMSASAAVRSGAGLVTVGCPASLNDILEVKLTEEMTLPLDDNMNGVLSTGCIDKILTRLEKSDVILYGPGLSADPSISAILEAILAQSVKPVIIDADGINALAANINILREAKCPVVLTPHPGEMSRLTGIAVRDIQANRIHIAKDFAQKWNTVIILKGARTVVALPAGDVYINCTGNPGMATGGSGDVLAGVIAAFMGQGIPVAEAAIAAVYIHGLAGDIAAERYGEYSLKATDIIEALPEAFKRLENSG